MRITLRSKSNNKTRLLVPIDEFAYAAFPVRVKRFVRHVPVAAGPQTKSNDARRSGRIYS